MEKEYIQSNNCFVADSMNELPRVIIDNVFDENDGGFKIDTIVELGKSVVVYTKTIAQSKTINNKRFKKHKAPDYEIFEIDFANKQTKIYKVKLSSVEALSDENLSWYENRNKIEEVAGDA